MSRRLLCAAITGAALLLVPSLASAHETATTITEWVKTTRFEAIDQNGGGMGMGDLYAGTFDMSATRGGAKNGTTEWSGTVVRENMPGASEYRSVQWRVMLKGGSLLVNGIFQADQGVAAHTPRTQTLYVTGGAGKYFGAHGSVTSTTLNKTERKWVFQIIGADPQS